MICLCIVVGAALSRLWYLNSLFVLGVAIAGAGFAVWRANSAALFLAVAAGVLIGVVRGSIDIAELRRYEVLYGTNTVMTAAIKDDPKTKHGSTQLQLGDIRIKGRPMKGKIWASSKDGAGLRREDTVMLQGILKPGFGSFVATMSPAQLITARSSESVPLAVRSWFSAQLEKVLTPDARGLAMGFLTGEQSQLSPGLEEAFRSAGLIHIVVASGYNLTVLVQLARRLFERHSHYVTATTTVGLIVFFIGITGLSPSMTRAGLVAGLGLLAWYMGRTMHPFVLLPFAAAATVLVSPDYVWGDAGWLLSFASFAGVLVMAGALQHYFFGRKQPGVARQVLGETVAAWLCTLPIIALLFGAISMVAIPAVVPFIPIVMLLACICAVAAAIFPFIAPVFAWCVELLSGYIIWVATTISSLEGATMEVHFNWWMAVIFYSILGGWVWWMLRVTKMRALLPSSHPHNTEVD